MKYLVVGLLFVIYLLIITGIMHINNNVVYQPQIIELGETYENQQKDTEYRSDTEVAREQR